MSPEPYDQGMHSNLMHNKLAEAIYGIKVISNVFDSHGRPWGTIMEDVTRNFNINGKVVQVPCIKHTTPVLLPACDTFNEVDDDSIAASRAWVKQYLTIDFEDDSRGLVHEKPKPVRLLWRQKIVMYEGEPQYMEALCLQLDDYTEKTLSASFFYLPPNLQERVRDTIIDPAPEIDHSRPLNEEEAKRLRVYLNRA